MSEEIDLATEEFVRRYMVDGGLKAPDPDQDEADRTYNFFEHLHYLESQEISKIRNIRFR